MAAGQNLLVTVREGNNINTLHNIHDPLEHVHVLVGRIVGLRRIQLLDFGFADHNGGIQELLGPVHTPRCLANIVLKKLLEGLKFV